MSDTTGQIIDDFSRLIMEHAEAIRDDLLPGAPRGRTARAITRYAQIIHAAELAIDTLTDPAPANDEPGDLLALPEEFAMTENGRVLRDAIPHMRQDTRDDGNGAQVTA